jgi:hypothetical protein
MRNDMDGTFMRTITLFFHDHDHHYTHNPHCMPTKNFLRKYHHTIEINYLYYIYIYNIS